MGKHRVPRQRKFTDEQAFALWQQYQTDAEIASCCNVTRARIQAWRDTMELPSTSRQCVDTKKYRLTSLSDGTVFAVCDEN